MFTNKAAAAGRASEQGGFTLIETCISLLIMMVAGLGVVTLFTFAVTFNEGASDRARAFAVAQQRMERIRSTSYPALTAAFAAANSGVVQQGAAGSDLRRFDVVVTITDELVVAGSARRKTINVTVTPQATAEDRWSSGAVSLVAQRASTEMGPF